MLLAPMEIFVPFTIIAMPDIASVEKRRNVTTTTFVPMILVTSILVYANIPTIMLLAPTETSVQSATFASMVAVLLEHPKHVRMVTSVPTILATAPRDIASIQTTIFLVPTAMLVP